MKRYVQSDKVMGAGRPKVEITRPSELGLDPEPWDTGYGVNITNYVWENTQSAILNDAFNRDKISLFISAYPNGKLWWFEGTGVSEREYKALMKEMTRLFPNSAYFYS